MSSKCGKVRRKITISTTWAQKVVNIVQSTPRKKKNFFLRQFFTERKTEKRKNRNEKKEKIKQKLSVQPPYLFCLLCFISCYVGFRLNFFLQTDESLNFQNLYRVFKLPWLQKLVFQLDHLFSEANWSYLGENACLEWESAAIWRLSHPVLCRQKYVLRW